MGEYEEWLEELGIEVMRYLRKAGASKEDAEDIMQNTFYKILTLMETMEASELRPWFYRVAINEFFDFKRKEQRTQTRFLKLIHQFKREPETKSEELSDALQILEQLKPEYREILLLKAYGDLSYTQIAERLGICEDTVRTKLYRARKKARELREEIDL